ncbi:MAG: hypothetical protein ACLP9L_22275, partial [Thermoguttaceae bacterium]
MTLMANNATDAGHTSAASPRNSREPAWPKWAIGLLLVGHVWAACHILPPTAIWNYPILPNDDFPAHAHRASVFREAYWTSGATWGCDPAVCGGMFMHPTQEVGSALYEIPALLLPGVETGTLVTAIVWSAMLLFPVFLWGAGRLLAFDNEQLAWGLLLADGFLWLSPAHRLLLHYGMVAFLLSSYVCLFVLAVYVWFLRRPTLLRYAGMILAGGGLFLAHPFGPLAIAPGLAWLILRTPGVRWPWRLAAIISPLPIAAVNALWLIPVVGGLGSPPPPWMTNLNLTLKYWNWSSLSDFLWWVEPVLLVGLAVVSVVSCLGLAAIARRQPPVTTVALGITLLLSLLLFFFGSYWPPTRILQPVRFVTVFLNLAAMLAGCAVAGLSQRLRLPRFVWPAAFAIAGMSVAVAVEFLGERLEPESDGVQLINFIQRRPIEGERVLLEGAWPFPWLGLGLPAITHREIISTTFPDDYDPIQFTPKQLFRHSPKEISADQARQIMARLGVNWVIVRSDHWQQYFRKLAGGPDETFGPYAAFHVSRDRSRFLVGAGEVRAGTNRLELQNVSSPEGYVVLRYRYHPGWTCDAPSSIERFPTPDNSGGLLLIRHPSPTMRLRFDPKR